MLAARRASAGAGRPRRRRRSLRRQRPGRGDAPAVRSSGRGRAAPAAPPEGDAALTGSCADRGRQLCPSLVLVRRPRAVDQSCQPRASSLARGPVSRSARPGGAERFTAGMRCKLEEGIRRSAARRGFFLRATAEASLRSAQCRYRVARTTARCRARRTNALRWRGDAGAPCPHRRSPRALGVRARQRLAVSINFSPSCPSRGPDGQRSLKSSPGILRAAARGAPSLHPHVPLKRRDLSWPDPLSPIATIGYRASAANRAHGRGGVLAGGGLQHTPDLRGSHVILSGHHGDGCTRAHCAPTRTGRRDPRLRQPSASRRWTPPRACVDC